MSAPYIVETIGKSHLPITSWCCTCDKELTMDDGIGPWNHLAGEGGGGPDHYVIQVEGRLAIYRPRDAGNGRSELRRRATPEDVARHRRVAAEERESGRSQP